MPLPHPRVAVLIGGRSAAFDLTPDHASALADDIARAIDGGGRFADADLLASHAAEARRIMTERLSALPGLIWDETGDNPSSPSCTSPTTSW